MFCQYKDILGRPNEGFHAAKLFGLARNDLIGTIIIVLLIAYANGFNYITSLFIAFILIVIVHRLFCVNTALNVMIFGEV